MPAKLKTLAERLKWARNQARISQRALARAAQLKSERHVGQFESGERDNPELKTLQALADALGLSIGWLANGDGEMPEAQAVQAAAILALKEVGEEWSPTDEHKGAA